MTYSEVKVAGQENLDSPEHLFCPIPLSVIPNHMGIHLSSVKSISWVKQDDGQLLSLTIKFLPEPKEV